MADLQSGLRIPVEILRPSTRYTMPGVLFEGDENANRITLVLMQNGESVDIGTVSVSGEVERADGNRVPCKGEQNGNELSIILNANCYNVPGACNIFVIAKSEGVERTLAEINAHVRGRSNGAIVEVENVIPSIADILQRIDELEAAGIATVEAIEAKGQKVLESLPDDYTALAGEVSHLSDEMAETGLVRNYDGITMTPGAFVGKNGELVDNADFSYSDYIRLADVTDVYSVMGYNAAVAAYYDDSYICVGNLDTTENVYTPQWWHLDPPESAVYVRFCNRDITMPAADVKYKKVSDLSSMEAAIKDLQKQQSTNSDVLSTSEVVDLSNGVSGFVNYVGQIVSGGEHSNPFILPRGKTLTFRVYSAYVLAPIARYNGDDKRYSPLVIGSGSKEEQTVQYTAIEDTPIVLSWYSGLVHEAVITEKFNLEDMTANIRDLQDLDYSAVITRMLNVGDSLTAGDFYPDAATVSVGDNAKSYPYFLSKEMNIECVNMGSSGATPETWFDRLYAPTVFDNFDCLMLWLGTNHGLTDTLATDVDAFESYMDYTGRTGKYCRIIEEFQDKNDDAPVVLVKCFDGARNADEGVTLESTNSVIDKIAAKYGLQTIDTMDLAYYDPDHPLHSTLRTRLHTKNTLHFSTFGNMYIAHKFHLALNDWWKNNIDKMDHPYRVRGNELPWWKTN